VKIDYITPQAVKLSGTMTYEVMEIAARNCYKSEPKTDARISSIKFVTRIGKKLGHESILENEGMVFLVNKKDVDHEKILEWIKLVPDLARGLDDTEGYFVVSGNMRMFLELSRHLSGQHNPFFYGLTANYGELFDEFEEGAEDRFQFIYYSRARKDDVKKMFTEHGLECDWKKHALFTALVTGSRTMSHQLVRHRRQVIGQESQRWIDYAKKGHYKLVRPKDSGVITKLSLWLSLVFYHYVLRRMKAEDRRQVLPGAMATSLVITNTYDGWLHVIGQRTSKKAQDEIRNLILEINEIIKTEISE
jgi:thymidylate synthase ThyX